MAIKLSNPDHVKIVIFSRCNLMYSTSHIPTVFNRIKNELESRDAFGYIYFDLMHFLLLLETNSRNEATLVQQLKLLPIFKDYKVLETTTNKKENPEQVFFHTPFNQELLDLDRNLITLLPPQFPRSAFIKVINRHNLNNVFQNFLR